MKRNNSLGISLISLIITIIVIIILAGITMFSSLDSTDRANFARFTSEFSDITISIENNYVKKFTENSILGKNREDAQIYYEIASGVDVGENGSPYATATITELGITTYPNRIKGNQYYEILESNDADIKFNKTYFDKNEKYFITDEGETFLLPGYLVKEDGVNKWWINEDKYYISDKPLMEPMNIVVRNVQINQDIAGTQTAGKDVEKGTALYIDFETKDKDEIVNVTPDIPYAITTNGRYKFTLTSSSGKTRTETIVVTNYDVPTIAEVGMEIGDYVKYEGDGESSYILKESITGDASTDGTELKPTANMWRVWDIKSNGDVVIMPTTPPNSFAVYGAKGFKNALSVIEGVCDIYTNKYLGVTKNDIRSLTTADLEDTKRSSNLVSKRDSYTNYGKTNVEIFGGKGYVSGEFYIADDGRTILDTPRIATEENPIVIKNTYYYATSTSWKSINSSKFPTATYGTLIGNSYSWLASPCIVCYENYAAYYMCYVRSTIVGAQYFGNTLGDIYGLGSGVRPLVTLKSSLPVNDGNGKSSSTAWNI